MLASLDESGKINLNTLSSNLKSIGATPIADNFPATAILNGYSYKINSNGSVEKQEKADRTGIKVGDYINFEPDTDYDEQGNPTPKTYSKEYLAEKYTWNTYNTEDLLQEPLKWQVLKIYEDGSIKLIGSESNAITLGGPNSYNNSVWILNDVCEQLYSKKSVGIIARSVNMSDFEDDDYYVNETEGNWKIAKDRYIDEQIANRKEELENSSAYIQNVDLVSKTVTYKKDYSYYPKIYIYENGSGIDTLNIKTNGITGSNKFAKNIEELDVSTKIQSIGNKQANNFLTTQYTGYQIDINKINYGDAYEILKGKYWIATRAVECNSEYASFGIYRLIENEKRFIAFTSSYRSQKTALSGVRPIVNIDPSVKITLSDTASSEDGTPHTITEY